ncbi:hypothetical protein A9R16_003000 [Acidiferrobacter thiooxydans]|uniref:plastocyanin/azurin family copper-binding protein n=1 Tax=Acidiferrobacter TaxID=986106 RepID=UPI0011472A50|nr:MULTISPECIES: plastocyanin/azurin family copper-binding protein [Acidiferrobacter]UEO00384.1 hypothetical protein A9R16_003000 [Acidiferrobacter thiooxydans]
MTGNYADGRRAGWVRALTGVVLGVGALLQAGVASAGPLVRTGAFKEATSSQVRAMLARDNGTVHGTIVSYRGSVARVTVVVPQPEFPFPKFEIHHVDNPTLDFRAGTTVKFTFIDRVMGFSHSFQITRKAPPFPMFPKIRPVLAGTELSPPPGDGKSVYADFTWRPAAGHYYYLCAIPGHAHMGMFGAIIVK